MPPAPCNRPFGNEATVAAVYVPISHIAAILYTTKSLSSTSVLGAPEVCAYMRQQQCCNLAQMFYVLTLRRIVTAVGMSLELAKCEQLDMSLINEAPCIYIQCRLIVFIYIFSLYES